MQILDLFGILLAYLNMRKKNPKVFVGMSGGVDSSVAVALLQERGFDVVGIHLKCFNVDGCAAQDAEDARRAAETLHIPFYVFDFEKEYKERVVQYMIDGYKNGITPNPDVMCNKEIKFGLFLEKALAMGSDYVATGHYVRLVQHSTRSSYENQNKFFPAKNFSSPSAHSLRHTSETQLNTPAGRSLRNSGQRVFSLLAAKDTNKDQSYFLWTLTQEQLKHCLFPIGDYIKPDVRKLARKFGLPNAEKKDSQGICFLGHVTLEEFLGDYLPKKKGIIVSTDGKIVGEHPGAHFYTIGQRHGLRVSNPKPYYVAEKDTEANALLVAEGEDHPLLYKKEIKLEKINLISHTLSAINHLPILARVRYRQPLAEAILTLKGNHGKLVFTKPQKFVALGQSAVLYSKKGEMLGGGIIV